MTDREMELAIAYLRSGCDKEKIKRGGITGRNADVAFVKGFGELKTSLYYQATEDQIEDARRNAITRLRRRRTPRLPVRQVR